MTKTVWIFCSVNWSSAIRIDPAVLQYRSFKLGSAKTLSSIMVTAVSNLHMCNRRRLRDDCHR